MPPPAEPDASPPALLCLVYRCSVNVPVGPLVIRDLLRACRRNNRAAGLSGLLVHHRQRFLQCLEGPPDAVRATYARIATDARHEDTATLREVLVPERAFGQWPLAYASVGAAAWTMLDHADWHAASARAPDAPHGLTLLRRVWDYYGNTWEADHGLPAR